MNRKANLKRLQEEEFDLCIIGAGASGAGCALDAALRGLKVALIDRGDFSGETSSKSTKLIHGGVRYLEQAFKKLDFAQLRQVRHGLEERHILIQNAPHLAHPIGLVTPVFSWWEGLYYFIGLKMYDFFAARKDTLPASRWLSKKTALEMMPGLTPRIHSAVLYYDGQLDDARYCLALVQSAEAAGAAVANHTEVIDFQKDISGKILSASVRSKFCDDAEAAFSIKAKCFLNCTGPYADHLRLQGNAATTPRIAPSKGVHVMLPLDTIGSDFAMLIPKTKDGRMVFAIPFEGDLLLGTTDQPYRNLDVEPVLEGAEVDFLLETLQPFVQVHLDKKQVKAGFAGIRPLVSARKKDKATKSLLRDHEVETDDKSGLVSLMGGKWTTYRLMAKDAIDVVCQNLGVSAHSTTESHPLVGANADNDGSVKKNDHSCAFDADVSQHLGLKYGDRKAQVEMLAAERPELRERILPGLPYIKAEIAYAVQSEMAVDIRDFLAHRIRLEITDWAAAERAAPMVAAIMGHELGWSSEEKTARLTAYTQMLHMFKNHI